MRKISVPVIAGIVLLASGIAGYALLFQKDDQPAAVANGIAQASATYYTCPMHPSVVSDRPGACPVCGMALVKKSLQHESSPAALEQLKRVTLSPTQRVLANVATTTVTRQTIARKITAMGSIAFAEPRQATVAARFRGRIEKLHASSTGVSVRKGDPLFELYSPDLISAEREFILALEAAEQAPGSANTQLESQLLHASRDRLSVHFGLTEEQIAGLERDRRIHPRWTFHSPIAGTVLQKLVQVGQYVNEGQVLYELADLSCS